MREVTPQELRKYNEKSWRETQKVFRRRLREIATSGNNVALYCETEYYFGERIKPWLESLGFTVKQDRRLNWYEVTWPEEEDVIERLRNETFKILTQPIPTKFTYGVLLKREEFGTWTKDNVQWDYVCSACGKHSEYATDFCCNCGKKMMKEKEK